QTTQVRSGEEALNRITGAQAPSGIPVTITAPQAERTGRSPRSSRGRRGPAPAARRVDARRAAFNAAAA
ncbi:ATP-dependent helicase, partial [Streptomyces sp. MB09-01]|nr:ATP-dependent helicase [Streptomyces sp. MB09-01]